MIWTNFPSSLLRQQWLWRFRGNHYPGAHLPMYWQNIHCLCTPVLGLVGAAAAHKGKSWGECSLTLQHKALNDASHTYDTVRVWRYDKAEWNSLITPPPLPRTPLCPRVWHTHLPAPCALQPHTPACNAGGVSCFSGDATCNQWAAVRTVRERGGNSPPIAALSTWEPVLPQGGAPSRPLSEWTPNKNSQQQVSYTSQC